MNKFYSLEGLPFKQLLKLFNEETDPALMEYIADKFIQLAGCGLSLKNLDNIKRSPNLHKISKEKVTRINHFAAQYWVR